MYSMTSGWQNSVNSLVKVQGISSVICQANNLMVQHLPGKHKVLNSVSDFKKRKRTSSFIYNNNTLTQSKMCNIGGEGNWYIFI